ncbi:zinc-dependent alcohol dehydrogenase [Anaerofustis stercorihominis]|uniref:GroES-like protein n=2 Tax=Anaerofustis stercorihominis TaxID=214853 RepID=B1CAC4_9FIRM|nr:zinc-binding dehydrogenase [Anaerofustis stercorihominis]EDS72635.1 GroES-like protein [Anaerofustis stercorihominis DSM 17244]MCQ4795028.1 zinc-binding dehydrogenase [Anaerofustis stercorihominis]RGD75505.1 alcohol dehydrogenase [Anaerofustis stercorihominis]
MKAAVLNNAEDLRIMDLEMPRAGEGEIIMKVKSALTCGTDVKTFRRGHPTIPFGGNKTAFGHEGSGVVYEVGRGVDKFKVGDRIAAHNTAPCHSCYSCQVGDYSMCDDLRQMRGTWAEYVKIPASLVRETIFKIPDTMSHKQAALLEPLSCAVYGVDLSDIKLGDLVVVNGCGPIGLMMLKCAKLKGATVIACDFTDLRLETAKKLGADMTVDLKDVDNQVEAVRELTPYGRGVDVAIEATGVPEVWEKNMLMARKGGMVMEFGGCKPGTTITVDTKLLHYSQLTIKGVYHTTPKHVGMAFELIKRGEFPEELMINKSFKLDKALDALLSHAKGEVIKNEIVID